MKLLKALLPRVLDVCVYEYMLSAEPPQIKPELPIDVEVKDDANGYTFFAKYNGVTINENHIIFQNRLGRQLGYSNVPMLADSNTAETYRGKGIQAYILNEIARYFAQLKKYKSVYVFTYSHNVAMQRSLTKANFIKIYRAKVYRVAGLCIFKKIVNE